MRKNRSQKYFDWISDCFDVKIQNLTILSSTASKQSNNHNSKHRDCLTHFTCFTKSNIGK